MRATALADFAQLMRDLGLDPAGLPQFAALAPSALDDPDAKVAAVVVGRLLMEGAAQAGRPDFALQLAARARLSDWGVIALVVREQSTMAGVIAKICQYIALWNEALGLSIVRAGARVQLQLTLSDVREAAAVRQSIDFCLAILFRNLGEIAGGSCRPVFVSFRCAKPRADRAYRRFFGAQVLFDQAFDGLVFEEADLSRALHGVNPMKARQVERYVDGLLDLQPRGLAASVHEVVTRLLPANSASSGRVAEELGLTVRTMQRRLAAEGATFAEVVQAVRDDLAKVYIESSTRPLSEAACLLGFGSQAAFSHWHRSRFGASPSERRKVAAEYGCPLPGPSAVRILPG
jgi:AraC-like DNA-binding protein